MAESEKLASEPGPFGFLSRRRLLKYGLLGGSVLLMGGAGGLLSLRGFAPEVRGLRILSAHEYRTLTALARTHLPAGGAFPTGAKDFDIARQFDDFLADEPEDNIRDLKRALMLLEFGPVLFERKAKTFSNLSPKEQLRHWESWMLSPMLLRRQVSTAFRKFISLVFYDLEKVWPHIGYPGPALGVRR